MHVTIKRGGILTIPINKKDSKKTAFILIQGMLFSDLFPDMYFFPDKDCVVKLASKQSTEASLSGLFEGSALELDNSKFLIVEVNKNVKNTIIYPTNIEKETLAVSLSICSDLERRINSVFTEEFKSLPDTQHFFECIKTSVLVQNRILKHLFNPEIKHKSL